MIYASKFANFKIFVLYYIFIKNKVFWKLLKLLFFFVSEAENKIGYFLLFRIRLWILRYDLNLILKSMKLHMMHDYRNVFGVYAIPNAEVKNIDAIFTIIS